MIMVVVLECRASSGPGDVVVTPREAPAHYGSREAPVVSRLGTTLAARRSLEGDLKVVLSFPGFGGERGWKWFPARNVANRAATRSVPPPSGIRGQHFD